MGIKCLNILIEWLILIFNEILKIYYVNMIIYKLFGYLKFVFIIKKIKFLIGWIKGILFGYNLVVNKLFYMYW